MYRVRLHMPRGKPIEDWISEHGILSMASEFVSPTYRYYQVLAHEPLLTYFRTPLPSLRWPSVRKAILSAMAAVHRVKPKDVIEILSIDGTEDADQAGLVRTLVRAYDGDPSSVPMAALYRLVRRPLHAGAQGQRIQAGVALLRGVRMGRASPVRRRRLTRPPRERGWPVSCVVAGGSWSCSALGCADGTVAPHPGRAYRSWCRVCADGPYQRSSPMRVVSAQRGPMRILDRACEICGLLSTWPPSAAVVVPAVSAAGLVVTGTCRRGRGSWSYWLPATS